jgi:antirestriction protein ArdC
MKHEDALEKVDGALAELETALANGQSETLKNYLTFLSRFHNYSFGNVILIYLQRPDASLVAGFQSWKKSKRHVKKGEKGIRILAPVTRKLDDEESTDAKDGQRRVCGFRTVSVFDVSQTDGEELPTIRGYQGDPQQNLERLEAFAVSNGIEVCWEQPAGGALGVSENGSIKVAPNLEPAETFAVLVHEVAHERLHKGARRTETTKVIRETEAEAVAFAVCTAVGLETGTAAADYIQLYSGDVEKLRESLEFIRVTASEILSALSEESPVVAA